MGHFSFSEITAIRLEWAASRTDQLSYAGSALILGTCLLLLAAVALSIGIPFTWFIVAKLIFLVFLVPLGLAWLQTNRPRRFVPPVVPSDVLPQILTSRSTSP